MMFDIEELKTLVALIDAAWANGAIRAAQTGAQVDGMRNKALAAINGQPEPKEPKAKNKRGLNGCAKDSLTAASS